LRKKVLIAGVGNLLLKDEGLGIHVVRELNKMELPEDVEVRDCGTMGLELLNLFSEYDKVIVIDAIRGGGEPGEVYKFSLDEVKLKKGRRLLSMHHLDLNTLLELGREIGVLPSEVVIIGAEPGEIELEIGLSKEVREKLPLILKLVMEELSKV